MRMSDDEILAALYDSVVENRRIEDALNLLAERFHCPSAGLISFDATIPQADSMAAIGVMGAAENLGSYRNTFSTIDPAPKAFSALRQGDVSATNILISPAQRRRCIFLNEFYRPIGLEECLGGNLSARNGHFALIGIHRGKDRRPFRSAEIEDLKRFTPHLVS